MTDFSADKLAAFLSDASRYFANRPIHGEDAAHWSNVYNAENCQKASAAILAMAEDNRRLVMENDRLRAMIDTPLTGDFTKATDMEALHQRERWGASHDAGKSPFDWFWLIGYLSQKAADAQVKGNIEKALHHTISTAAALANWHLAISGRYTSMRPGIDTPERALGEENAS